jgi:predicted P-loop ATPase
LNKLSSKPEQLVDGRWEPWGDADDAVVRLHFQSRYDLYNKAHLDDAFRIYLKTHAVDPLLDMLDGLTWDGEPRIEKALHHLTGCGDTPYTREVSRLLFAGGIHRAYRPGCKFDDVPVLVGRQGGGKSALVRLLAMDDAFFREVKTFEGPDGVEAINGGWIIEIPEMLATARAKEVELVKAYITRQEDTYRVPYDKYVGSLKRRCIFIGTTNNAQFLTDKTGNRRFYPLMCQSDGRFLFDHKEEIQHEIEQCWAEAYALYVCGQLPAVSDRELSDEIRDRQESATEDDWREGMIEEYLDSKNVGDRTCCLELWQRAMGMDGRPSKKDSGEITQIMQRFSFWKPTSNSVRMPPYGKQRGWYYAGNSRNEDMPF